VRLAACAAICFLAGAAAAGAPGDWPGWRGLEREGRVEPGDYPTHWSPSTNIRWKTPIPGKGHSSPIVVGERVFVTTAYFTGRGERLKLAASLGVLAATGLLVLLGAALAVGPPRSGARPTRGRVAALVCLCFILGAVASSSLALFGKYEQGEPNTERRMELWVLSAGGVSLCLMAASLALSGRAVVRLALAGAALAFGAFVVLGRPEPRYFDLVTPGRYADELFHAAAFAAAIGMLLLVASLVRSRREDTPPTSPQGRRAWFLVRCVAALAALCGGLALFKLWRPATQWQALGICTVAWLVASAARLGQRSPAFPTWLGAAFLALAALSFAERNYLLVSREFVRAIVCVDRESGKVRWTREGLRGPQPTLNRRNSPASPTPVSDGTRVCAWFGSAGAMCTDLDGRLLWTNRDLPFECVHGAGPSLVLAGGRFIVTGTQAEAPYIAALDPATGRRAWTARLRPWPGIEGQHRTPAAVKSPEGGEWLVLWNWDGPEKESFVRALDARTGRGAWRYPLEAHNEAVGSVVSGGGLLFAADSREAHALGLAALARGRDPVLWTTPLKGRGPHISSPVLCRGMLFAVSNKGWATCLDAKTGRLLWAKRIGRRGCTASLVAAGGNVYFCDVTGRTTVVAAEPEFRKVAENDLGEPIFASPAPSLGRLFIRTASHLWCIQQTVAPPRASGD